MKYALIAAATLLSATAANAQAVQFSGDADGCFGIGCTPTVTATPAVQTLRTISYYGSTFADTTVGGMLGLGGNGVAGTNFNNLGAFSLGTAAGAYVASPFTLLVTFTLPANSMSAGGGSFTASILGAVNSTGNGGALITFVPPTQTFTYNGGAFTLLVNNVSVNPGQVAAVSGFIVATPTVPEPASWAMMIGGFGLAGVALRRRKTSVSFA